MAVTLGPVGGVSAQAASAAQHASGASFLATEATVEF